MSITQNLQLTLTPEDDTTTTFKAWRLSMNGEGSDSNMKKIDSAYGDLTEQTEQLQAKLNTVSDKVFGETPKTWADVQSIVRNGAAAQYFDIGDQFIVERLSAVTASKGESTGITAVSVNSDTFVSGCGEVKAGEYLFTYDGKSWRKEDGAIIKIADYGITLTGTPVAGDHVIVTETTTQLKFDVIGIDHDTPADAKYTHSMTLQMHDLWATAMVYDASEALWYIDEETYPSGLEAGTYHFTLPAGYDNTYGGGSTFNFTLATTVPVGGQVRFAWNYNTQASACKIITYTSATSTTALETVGVTAGEAGTAMPTLSATAVTANTNCVHRMRYGSNNWAESGLRQWLNTDGAANTWWEPKTVFDRPTSAGSVGFLKGFDPAFLNVIGNVTKTTQKSISDGYGLETTTERFFLLSRPEIYAGTERGADGADGTVYAYYGAGHSDLTAPGTGADANRIKYRNGSATYWWLRTPNSGNGYNVRTVYPTGTLYNGNAYSSIGVAPACVIV